MGPREESLLWKRVTHWHSNWQLRSEGSPSNLPVRSTAFLDLPRVRCRWIPFSSGWKPIWVRDFSTDWVISDSLSSSLWMPSQITRGLFMVGKAPHRPMVTRKGFQCGMISSNTRVAFLRSSGARLPRNLRVTWRFSFSTHFTAARDFLKGAVDSQRELRMESGISTAMKLLILVSPASKLLSQKKATDQIQHRLGSPILDVFSATVISHPFRN